MQQIAFSQRFFYQSFMVSHALKFLTSHPPGITRPPLMIWSKRLDWSVFKIMTECTGISSCCLHWFSIRVACWRRRYQRKRHWNLTCQHIFEYSTFCGWHFSFSVSMNASWNCSRLLHHSRVLSGEILDHGPHHFIGGKFVPPSVQASTGMCAQIRKPPHTDTSAERELRFS